MKTTFAQFSVVWSATLLALVLLGFVLGFSQAHSEPQSSSVRASLSVTAGTSHGIRICKSYCIQRAHLDPLSTVKSDNLRHGYQSLCGGWVARSDIELRSSVCLSGGSVRFHTSIQTLTIHRDV